MAKQQHVLIAGVWEPTGGPPGAEGNQADITAHEAAADPHPVYLKNTEVIPGANMAVASNADGTVTVSAIVDATGAQHAMPYGVYSTNVAELGAASATLAYSIPFGVNVESSGITHSTTVNPHQFTVPSAGLYHVVVSAQVTITASPVRKKMFIWIAINGTDVTDATLTTEITNIDQIVPLEALYVMSLQANDIVSFKYAAEDVTVKFIAQPATTTPPKPASPAVVVTINKFSPLAGLDQEAADERYVQLVDYTGGGATILSGTTTPTAGTGAVGDYYLDTDDRVLYGPKVTSPYGGTSMITTTPTNTAATVAGGKTYGLRFQVLTSGVITHIRFWRAAGSTQTSRTLTVWDDTSNFYGWVSSSGETGVTGWFTQALTTPINAVAGTYYRLTYNSPAGDASVFDTVNASSASAHLTNLSAVSGAVGTFPGTAVPNMNYYVDLVMESATPAWPVALKSVPPGGTTSQVLAKTSGTDYAAGWATASGGSAADSDQNILANQIFG